MPQNAAITHSDIQKCFSGAMARRKSDFLFFQEFAVSFSEAIPESPISRTAYLSWQGGLRDLVKLEFGRFCQSGRSSEQKCYFV